ncbi:ABC transporter permease [Candidatus Avelusimicrobium faecicola]|uniref:ABC transporter permease n=1 Tax=Candidatus Avelusimicrobium faecicola TaxID=3416205 RepID=UPI0015A47F36
MKKIIHYIFKRECAFLFRRKKSRAFFVFIYPLIIVGCLFYIFSAESLTQIPVGVVDDGQGAASREMKRVLQANQFLNIFSFPSLPTAFKALRRGEVYGVVALDENYDKNLAKRTGAEISAWVNNEYLLVGGNLSKGLNAAVGAVNNRYQRKNLAALGIAPALWESFSAPLQVSEKVLYNPAINYLYFLGMGLVPAVFQLFICMSICYSLLWDIKTRHIRQLQHSYMLHPFAAVGTKLGFYIGAYFGEMVIVLAVLVLGFELPVQGSLIRIMAGILAFLFLTAATALGIAGCSNNLRLGLSICAMYSAPAFAYYGVSFPVQSMPVPARIWAECMPGTHLNRIFVNEFLRGADGLGSWWNILFMVILGLLLFWAGAWGYNRWVKQSTYWGPQL